MRENADRFETFTDLDKYTSAAFSSGLESLSFDSKFTSIST